MKFCRFLLLIFSVLQMTIFVNDCKSQITNELAFQAMLLDFIAKKPLKADTVSGFVTPDLLAKIVTHPGSHRRLDIEEPVVEFSHLQNKMFERNITSLVSYIDSGEVSFPLRFTDTIPRKDLAAVRKSQFLALRGTNPRWTAKYLLPVVLIGTGIAGIISLFYLRS